MSQRSSVGKPGGPTPSGRSMTQLDDFLSTPVGRLLYVAREARNLKGKPGRNMAVGFVDITGLDGLDSEGYEVRDVDELERNDPALYRQLRLAERPEIRRMVIIRQSNHASSVPERSRTSSEGLVDGFHSELLILIRELRYLGVTDPVRLFAIASDRSPCFKCARWIPRKADVFYLVQDGTQSAGKLNDHLVRTQALVEGSAEHDDQVAREKQRIRERAATNPKRRARLARQTRKVFRAEGSCHLGLGPGTALLGAPPAASRARSGGAVRQAAFTRRTAPVRAECAVGPTGATADVPDSGLVGALSEPVGQAPGGIDFSRLQLRYLADPGDGSGLAYSFQAPVSTTGGTAPAEGMAAARLSSDAFFVWLALAPQDFWVNLSPDEPDRVVDDALGRTDAGRVLLEADLRMKKTVGELIHPRTALGRRYWDAVQGDCVSSRTWIVPAPATVHEDGDRLYILDAPLDVRTETDYATTSGGSAGSPACSRQDRATEEHNEQLERTLVLPELREAVNKAPEYADLRQVYLARVAAEWYRGLSTRKHTTYGALLNSGDITDWQVKGGWTPRDTFDAYVESYAKGEFEATDETTGDGATLVTKYSYGGVDLTTVPVRKVTGSDFDAHHDALAAHVERSLGAPSVTGGTGTVWLGAPTPRQAADLAATEPPVSAGTWAVRLLPVLVLPLGLLLWRRRRNLDAGAASPLRRAARSRSRGRT
ncbi:hypothetical protein ACIPPJ_25620 [Streptomyces sp. NPDC086091]|uniref:hypothetical protein n=1 Tax=Streptomyces sp. NPDC086091 TaxID=3365751 RepID=UPI0037FE439A